MKRILVAAVLVLVTGAIAMAQQNKMLPGRTTADKKNLTDMVKGLVNNHGTLEDLKTLDDVCTTASVQGNIDALKIIEAEDFTFTGPDGAIVNKAQDLATIESGDLVYESINLSDVNVRVFGDAGVVTGKADVKGHYRDFDISGGYRYTVMFVKRAGHWQAVASQMTRIQQG